MSTTYSSTLLCAVKLSTPSSKKIVNIHLLFNYTLQNAILSLEQGLSPTAYQASLTADFAERDNMSQSNVPQNKWFNREYGLWGPLAKTFPFPVVPEGVEDPIQWKRDGHDGHDGQNGHNRKNFFICPLSPLSPSCPFNKKKPYKTFTFYRA